MGQEEGTSEKCQELDNAPKKEKKTSNSPSICLFVVCIVLEGQKGAGAFLEGI